MRGDLARDAVELALPGHRHRPLQGGKALHAVSVRRGCSYSLVRDACSAVFVDKVAGVEAVQCEGRIQGVTGVSGQLLVVRQHSDWAWRLTGVRVRVVKR